MTFELIPVQIWERSPAYFLAMTLFVRLHPYHWEITIQTRCYARMNHFRIVSGVGTTGAPGAGAPP